MKFLYEISTNILFLELENVTLIIIPNLLHKCIVYPPNVQALPTRNPHQCTHFLTTLTIDFASIPLLQLIAAVTTFLLPILLQFSPDILIAILDFL